MEIMHSRPRLQKLPRNGPITLICILSLETSPDAEIRIAFEQGAGSWSYIGTDCLNIPKSKPTMNLGWLTPTTSHAETKRVVLHEFGHALGLAASNQSPTANIPWNKQATYDYYQKTSGWTKQQVDTNLFTNTRLSR